MTGLIIVWLLLLTFFSIYIFSLIFRLFSVKDRGLKQAILENVEGNRELRKELATQKKDLTLQKERLLDSLQKVSLVRFNPFERIGGEQSYCMALLNEKNSGVVVTLLYTKEGVRAYVKEIERSQGKGVDLSKEEKEAVEKTVRIN